MKLKSESEVTQLCPTLFDLMNCSTRAFLSFTISLSLLKLMSIVEKAVATHFSTLAWQIPWTEEPGGLQSMGSLRVGHTERLHFHFSLSCIGEGNGNPLQCSCLENLRDGRAWWAAIYGVSQSWTQLKQLSSSSSYVDNDNLYLTYYTGSSE